MADPRDQERTIQGEAKECRSLLADTMVHLSRHDPLSIGIELQDELGRFNLWAGNIGVFAPLQASLDFRLIDVPDIRSQFLRQLDTLIITLIQLNEAATQATTEQNEHAYDEDAITAADASRLSDHDIVDIVQSIHVTIDWLHRLSNLVRKASFGSQNQRAAKFPLVDEAGNDITESLAEIFKHLVKRECCDISDQILDRLAQTMITRRRRVLYRRSRQNRWALQQESYRPQNLDPPTQLTPLQEADEPGEVQEGSEVTEEVDSKPEHRAQTTLSKLTVTTLDQQKYRKLAAPSRISRATTAPFQHNEKLLVPPPPSLAKEAEEFVCDYCCLILPSSEAAGQDTWANHVKKDLDPYICVFDDCSQPYQIYSSSKEWLSHMRSEHRMSWRCVVRDHPPQTFETREAFLNHMTEAHPGRFRKEQLPFIAESSARALNPTIPACPFCAEESGDLENHVAQHLCHFALQSLPWPEHLDQGSEIGSGQEIKSSEDVDRETLKDDLNDGLNFIDADWTTSFKLTPEPLLDTPVSWPSIGRAFPETDQVLSEFAAHAAKRGAEAPNDIQPEPETLDEELHQVREQFPDIVLDDADININLLRASLRGPWGVDGENVVLEVRIELPRAYPEAQAPRFQIEKDEYMPEWVRVKLEQEVNQVCRQYVRRACLAAAFSYLLGRRDRDSGISTFNMAQRYSTVLEPVDENPPSAALPVSQPDAIGLSIFAHDNKATEPNKVGSQPKAGYLTKRGKNLSAWESRFYVVDGPQLKYFDAEGGAQLGSIELHGAQIGKQQRQDDTTPAVDNQYNHAMLILESKKGSGTIKHVLCAESDEERDLWVAALSPWVNYAEPEEKAKTAERDRSAVSESQTKIPQPSTFDVLKYGNSGQLLPVQYIGHFAEIASDTIADCFIVCLLDQSKSEFGTFEGLPAGIIYMDIIIGATSKNLKSITIKVFLDDKNPDPQKAVRDASANRSGGSDRPVTLTSFYGPNNTVIRRSKDPRFRNPHLQAEAETMGIGIGGTRAGQNTTWSSSESWRILSRLTPSFRSVCWDFIPSDLDIPSPDQRVIHTGFVFHGGGQPFSLKVEIKGKGSKISDRIKQTSIQIATSNRNSSKQGKIVLVHSDKDFYRPLDELARALPEAMIKKNELQVPRQRTGASSVTSVDMRSGHGVDKFVGAEATFDPRIKGTRIHDFDAPRPKFQPQEDVGTDEGRDTVLSTAPMHSTLTDSDSLDQSPMVIGDDRDNRPQGSRAHETIVKESRNKRMEDDFQEQSHDNFLHEDTDVEKTSIRGSNLGSGEQAQRSMIPRYARKRHATKMSESILGAHLEQLNREYEI